MRVACWISKTTCTTRMHTPTRLRTHMHARTLTQTNKKYLLLYHGKSGSRTRLSITLYVHCLSFYHYCKENSASWEWLWIGGCQGLYSLQFQSVTAFMKQFLVSPPASFDYVTGSVLPWDVEKHTPFSFREVLNLYPVNMNISGEGNSDFDDTVSSAY